MPWIEDDVVPNDYKPALAYPIAFPVGGITASQMVSYIKDPYVWVDRNQNVDSISGMEITHLRAVIQFLRNGNYAYGQGHKLPSLEAELARRALIALPEVIDYFKEHLK